MTTTNIRLQLSGNKLPKTALTNYSLEYNPFETNCFPLLIPKKPMMIDLNATAERTFALSKTGEVVKECREYVNYCLFKNLYHGFGLSRLGRRLFTSEQEFMFFTYLYHIKYNTYRSNLRKICNINIDRLYDIVYTHIDKLKSIEKRRLLKLMDYKINMEVY